MVTKCLPSPKPWRRTLLPIKWTLCSLFYGEGIQGLTKWNNCRMEPLRVAKLVVSQAYTLQEMQLWVCTWDSRRVKEQCFGGAITGAAIPSRPAWTGQKQKNHSSRARQLKSGGFHGWRWSLHGAQMHPAESRCKCINSFFLPWIH